MIPTIIVLSLLLILALSICLYISRLYGGIKQVVAELEDQKAIDEKRNNIARMPNKSADELLDWMRSPHSQH